MSILTLLAPGAGWTRLAVGTALQVAGVVLVSALFASALLRRRAAARHGLWLGALVWVLLSPAVAAVADRAGLALWEVGPPFAPTIAAGAGGDVAAVPAPPDAAPGDFGVVTGVDPPTGRDGDAPMTSNPILARAATSQRDPSPTRATPAPALPGGGNQADPFPTSKDGFRWADAARGGLAAAWAAGVLVGLSRLAFGWSRLVRLVRAARPIDARRHATAFAQARETLSAARLPPVLTSPAVTGPVAVGVFRPRVVLPDALVGALDGTALRDVLVHECAHALRGDPRVGLLQRLAAALFWPHPLVHLLNAQLARAREEVCDNHVLARGDPCGYARTLLMLTELCRPYGPARAGIGLLTARWTLADRVTGLLDPRRVAMTRMTVRGRIAVAAALGAAGLAVAGVRFNRTTRAEGPNRPETPAVAAAPVPDEAGRPLKGVVVDEEGKPVAGAVVRLVRVEKAPGGATTAPDGTFTLALRGRMLLREDLVAEADGGARLGLARFHEPRDSRQADPVRIVLKPGRPLAVHVEDAAGAAVPGASVVAFDFGASTHATTDPDGDATLRLPADGQVRWVIALKPGVGFDYFENYATRGAADLPPSPPRVALTLDGARTVRVKAIDSAGKPLPGVTLSPWHVTKAGKVSDANLSGIAITGARTGADGVAVFGWLPKQAGAGVPFLVRSDGFSCPEPPVHEGTGAPELTARLLRNTRLSGTVRFPDGRPAPGVLVQAEGRGPTSQYGRLYTRTRLDGTYAVDVDPEQSYLVAVIDAGWAARSFTDVVVREGKPQGGLDFSLIKGTVFRGRITEEPADRPAAGMGVTLIQKGGTLPEGFVKRGLGEGEPSLVRFADTDAEGRYEFRVGPGRFQLLVPPVGVVGLLTKVGDGGADIVRDVSLPEPPRARTIKGVVIEKAPSGDRPLGGVAVEAVPVGRPAMPIRAVADAGGRFVLEQPGGRYARRRPAGGGLVLYARGADGRVAGFTTVPEGAGDVTTFVSEASRATGRVVDGEGRPRAGWRVDATLESGPDPATSARFHRRLKTDGQGRFALDGVVVGARGEVMAWGRQDDPRGGFRVESFSARGRDPIELPDLVVASGPADDAGKPRPAAGGAAPEEAPRGVPAWPSRAEVEGLIRALGRGPVTPELADQVSLMFRPEVLWAYDLDRTQARATDPEFVRRLDAAARQAFGRPATALELIRRARGYHVGYDDAMLVHFLRRDDEQRKGDPAEVTGVVRDGQSGRAVVGARVYTDDALTRTDDAGRFALRTRPPLVAPYGRLATFWVEADGFALREVVDQPDVGRESTVHLLREVAFDGRVLDDQGRPVPGALVSAAVDRAAVGRDGGRMTGGGNVVQLAIRTDDRGRFSVRGVPPSERPVHVTVRHPAYQRADASRVAPITPDEPFVIRLKPGCVVAGVVVDEKGRPVAGADVEVRKPSSTGYEHLVLSDGEGRFRFRDVSPGQRDLLVQPERHAPARVAIVADPARPVETQVVLSPGAYVSGKVVGEDNEPVADAAVGWADSLRGEFRNLGRMTCTAADGTFRLGPLPQGEFRLTGLADPPRRLGKVRTKENQADAVIRLEPDPIGRTAR